MFGSFCVVGVDVVVVRGELIEDFAIGHSSSSSIWIVALEPSSSI